MTGGPKPETIRLHGEDVSYRLAGDGPLIVLVHGITSTGETWREVMPKLAERHTVLAPDLLGHGRSAKPRGDYSLGAAACGIRDLLVALDYERATFVGHSLGGGVVMQLSYQFPGFCERLVLVSSGGLGEEVHIALRAATLPGSEWVLPLIAGPWVRDGGAGVGRLLRAVGVRPTNDLGEFARGWASLADGETRQAFVHTLRAVIDPRGQRVSAHDRLYLAAEIPTLIMWGARDRIIPPDHGREAHAALPGSRFELLGGSGHFPHLDQPQDVVELLDDFVASTKPASVEPGQLRRRLLEGAEEPS